MGQGKTICGQDKRQDKKKDKHTKAWQDKFADVDVGSDVDGDNAIEELEFKIKAPTEA